MRLIPLWGIDLSRHVCTLLILGRQSWAKQRGNEEVSLARATISDQATSTISSSIITRERPALDSMRIMIMFDCGSSMNRTARSLYMLAIRIDVPGTAGLLYPASLKSCLIRFGRLPAATGAFSVMSPNGSSYAGLDRQSTDDKDTDQKWRYIGNRSRCSTRLGSNIVERYVELRDTRWVMIHVRRAFIL